MNDLNDYSSIDFGEASAEEELDKKPSLISDGFYNSDQILEKITNSREFLILGNKGSGKSIIGEHIKITSGLQEDGTFMFVSKSSMKDFPYKSFAKIIPGDGTLETKLPLAWQWAILAQVIFSLGEDAGKEGETDAILNRAIDHFRSIGILPTATISDVVRISSGKNFTIKLSEFEYSQESTAGQVAELTYSNVVSHLKSVCCHLQSPNKHLIIIDGLDEQLNEKNHQYEAIASLIVESRELNSFFRSNNIPAKIIILCRKDIYSRLPGANKNKLQSYSIPLNWYEDQVETPNKNIIKLVQFRAKISGHSQNIFRTHFLAEYPGNKSPEDYLLENTRYTPRDLIKLLSFIKNFKTEGRITTDQIERSVKSYSSDYFWPEVEDELDGYFLRTEIATLKQALIHFHRREFLLSEFETFCRQNDYELKKLKAMFETLYDCGAISKKLKDQAIFFSKMRDQNEFNERLYISIHRGALKALNLPATS